MLNTGEVGDSGRGQMLAITITVHEPSQSNRSCNIFNFTILDFLLGYNFSIFYLQEFFENNNNVICNNNLQRPVA
jgi:hypothetical protein